MRLRKKRPLSSIPVAAMGDIAFLLLVFYIATTVITDQKPLDVDIPHVESEVQAAPYPLILFLNKDLASRESVYFFNKEVKISRIHEVVSEKAYEAPTAVKVYLNMEKNLPYKYMNSVIDELKEAGIRNLIITTRTPEQ